MYIVSNAAIYLGLALSIFSFLAFLIGIVKKDQRWLTNGKRGVLLLFVATSTAMVCLLILLGTGQFQYEYVHNYTSSDLPLVYKFASLWAGSAGSLLFWTFFLTLYTLIIVSSKNIHDTGMAPYAAAVMLPNAIFFFFMLSFVQKPFVLLDQAPIEGRGLNPLLQNPWMLIHPVTLYLGYVGISVPFACGMAALLTKKMEHAWILITRKWTLSAWLFLTIGNLLGAKWAYMELGWGGYWAWDPVENASFMPWLTITAFLHSAMIQERKNMLKVWNVNLIILSYALTLFGTYLVRSGILTSVHAFANTALGNYFLIYMASAVLISVYIVMTRYHLLKEKEGQIQSFLSKENSFLVNNMLFTGAAFAVLWGTIYPIVTQAVTGSKVKVDSTFFDSVEGPLLLGVLFLMGICPLIPWQRGTIKTMFQQVMLPILFGVAVCSGLIVLGITQIYPLIGFGVVAIALATHVLELYRGIKDKETVWKVMNRNRRRYGGYLAHIGVAFIAAGVIGSNSFSQEMTQTVSFGNSVEIAGYTLTYQNIGHRQEEANKVFFAEVKVEKDGQVLGVIQPQKVFYGDNPEPASEVGMHSSWIEDVYLVLASWEADGRATFMIKVNPLVNWIWFGGLVMVAGALIALRSGKGGLSS